MHIYTKYEVPMSSAVARKTVVLYIDNADNTDNTNDGDGQSIIVKAFCGK